MPSLRCHDHAKRADDRRGNCPGSRPDLIPDSVEELCEPRVHPALYLSAVAEVEVVAALRRLGRHEGYHPSLIAALQNRFERHLARSGPGYPSPYYVPVTLVPEILTVAAALCAKHWEAQPYPLRSLDAIQLASALVAARRISEELIFVTADVRLAAIAPQEGFPVINPLSPPQS